MTTAPSVTAPSRRDLGRIVFMPLCLLLAASNGIRLLSGATLNRYSAFSAVALTTSALLTLAFYWLMIRAYLTRLPVRATTTAVAVNAAALVATALPLVIPLIQRETTAAVPLVVGDLLLLSGLGWSVWSLRSLGRSFSVIPQARAVVSTGPYRLVRHPLYLGEIVATLGLAILRPSPTTIGIWLVLCVLQAFRATREEEVLATALPDYDSYRAKTRRLLPGLY
jgi:protein-S-isoprenylcysteine O-methyltransferase Ste14